MVYNRKKALREYHRQAVLTQSWSYINAEMKSFMTNYDLKTQKTQKGYLLNWCKLALSNLKSLNLGFPENKPQVAVKLLLSRILRGTDTPLYNAQQIYIQSSRMI